MPRDERVYITLHNGMPDHPKVDPLSDGAFRLLINLWCWCSRNETDGRVPEPTWKKRGTPKSRRELIEVGLVEIHGDKIEMHDYLEHQRSADEIAELREKRRAAGSKGGRAKASATALGTASATANGIASALANGQQSSSKSLAETETDRTRHTSSSSAQARATRIPDDWQPSPEAVEWQRREGIADDTARRQLPRFVDYWRAIAGDKGRKLDWDATWRNWLRREHDGETRTAAPKRPPGWEFGQ